MNKRTSIRLAEQKLHQSASDAIFQRILASVQMFCANDGAQLSDLLKDAIVQGIHIALGKVVQAHAIAI